MALGFGDSSVNIVIKAKDEFSRTFSNIRKSLQDFQKAALISSGFGIAIAGGFAKAIETSISFESAFAGVKKTVDLSSEGFAELEQRFKDISSTTPTTFEDLSKIGELAGQLGVEGVDNLEKFTKTIADISVTTNLTAENAATSFARISNIMQEPIDNVDRMGSTIVDLGNNFATTEGEITNFAERIAGSGKIAGLSTSDIFGIATAFSSVGIEAEAGGTAVQKILLDLQKQGKTGIGSFTDFVDNLSNSGDDAGKVLDELGFKDVRLQRAFLSLAGSGGLLNETIETATSAWEENDALTEEAQKRYETLASQIQIAKNQLYILGSEIGDRITPFLRDYLIPAIKKVVEWWDNLNPKVQDAILIFGGVTAAVTLLAGAIALITFVSSPWLLIIGAIAIAIGAIVVAIIYWKEILIKLIEWTLKATQYMDKAWEYLKDQFVVVWEIIKNTVISVWNYIVDYIEEKINSIVDMINDLIKEIPSTVRKTLGIDLVGKVSLSGAKGSLTNIDDLKAQLQLERNARADKYASATNQILINVENIYGTDPDEMAEALNDKLNNMIST